MHLSVCCQPSHQSRAGCSFIIPQMKIYTVNQSKSTVGDPGIANSTGAPNHAPDLPCPVGIDLHPDIFDAAVLRQKKRAKDATVETRYCEQPTGRIAAWAKRHLDPKQHLLIIEATSNAFDAVGKLFDAGFSCIVVESNQTSKVANAFFDNDQTAAERIARCYLTGMAKVVWVPDEKTCERRELLHAYHRGVTDNVRANNELKSFLTARNIRPGNRNLHLEKNRKWVEKQLDLSGAQIAIFEQLYSSMNYTKKVRDQYYRMICEEMLSHKQMLSCLRVVGIGMINAFAIVAIVGDIQRFATPEKLVSYLGLNPGNKKSGKGKDYTTGTGNRGRSDMRSLLIQAAQCVLNQAKKGNQLGKWGFRLFARKGNRNVAVVAVARKLAHSLYYVLSGRSSDLIEQRKPMQRKFCQLSGEIGKEGRKALGLPEKRADFIALLFERVGWPEPEPESAK